jgi:hypothetical protein
MSAPLEWQRYNRQIAFDAQYQRMLDRRAARLARDLLSTEKELGWGSGVPYQDAMHRLHLAAVEMGLVKVDPPAEPPANKRKPISRRVVRQVWDRDGWECVTCHRHADLTVDHILPLALGGTNDLSNLQTMCRSCNCAKGAKLDA